MVVCGGKLMVQNRELELQLAEAFHRLELVELQVERLKNPLELEWMSPAEIERYSKGKYRASRVRETIQQAIDHPADSPLKLGEHYTIERNEKGRSILINYPEFDRLMTIAMRESVFS